MSQVSIFNFSRFCQAIPSDAEAIKLFDGSWTSLIPNINQCTGELSLFDDIRIHWLLSQIDIRNQPVLELGPLEGGHTYMLEKIGGGIVTSIEGNVESFIRCLIIKNIFSLKAKFLLGDLTKYIIYSSSNFKLITLSGVLYHQLAPEILLYEASMRSDNLFIWTHYYDPARPAENISSESELRIYKGCNVNLFKHTYLLPNDTKFSGGMNPYSMWLDRASLLNLLTSFGYKIIIHSENIHPIYPDILLLARR